MYREYPSSKACSLCLLLRFEHHSDGENKSLKSLLLTFLMCQKLNMFSNNMLLYWDPPGWDHSRLPFLCSAIAEGEFGFIDLCNFLGAIGVCPMRAIYGRVRFCGKGRASCGPPKGHLIVSLEGLEGF